MSDFDEWFTKDSWEDSVAYALRMFLTFLFLAMLGGFLAALIMAVAR